MLARESLVALSRQMELIAETFEVELPQSSQAESLSPELERAIARTMGLFVSEVRWVRAVWSVSRTRKPHQQLG